MTNSGLKVLIIAELFSVTTYLHRDLSRLEKIQKVFNEVMKTLKKSVEKMNSLLFTAM